MHRLPFSVGRKSSSKTPKDQSNVSKPLDSVAKSKMMAFPRSAAVAPASDCHRLIENGLEKRHNLESIIRSLEYRRNKLKEEIIDAGDERDQALIEATETESLLHAKKYEAEQIRAQAAQGKVAVEALDVSVHKLMTEIDTAKRDHEKSLEMFLDECSTLNAQQRELRAHFDDSLLDWTCINHEDAVGA